MENSDVVAGIGARLKEERERLKLTQVELAALAGVTNVTQSRYEAGATAPNASYLAQFAFAGADILYVVTGTRAVGPDPMNSRSVIVSAEEAALLDNYKHADDQGRDAARRVLSSLAKQKAA